MPLSGSVTAGSAALASQYNNLRTDVVSTTQGHTHTGVSENGAQIEGTVIKSTSATNGYVLTANGSNGAAWVASSGPTVASIYGTAAFSTAANGGSATLMEGAGAAGVFYPVTTGNGSIVAAVQTPDSGATGGRIITTWNTGGTTRTGGTTWANVVAGTAWFIPTGQGFATATSQGFIVREISKTSTVLTTTIRKFTNALTNSWNTQLMSGTVAAGAISDFGDSGPFAQLNGYGPTRGGAKWAAGPGIWYGNDYRDAADYTTAGTMQRTSMWIINDATGSAYSAPFGSATTGNGSHISCSIFVPSATAATNGTIHAWGVDNASARYVTYSVGSASISALGTTDYTFSGATWSNLTDSFPFPVVQIPGDATWIESESRVMMMSRDAIIFTDRTVGTVLAVSNYRTTTRPPYNYGNISMGGLDSGGFDATTRYITYNSGANLSIIGSFDGMALPLGLTGTLASGYTSTSTLAGPGSATLTVGINSSTGTCNKWSLGGVARVQLDASSTANRLITIDGGFLRERLIAVGGGGSATDMFQGTVSKGPVPFIASGTQPVTAYVLPLWETAGNDTYSASTPRRNDVAGGTCVVKATKVTLA